MINNKKVYALIPARSGSKRIKDKNIRMLCDIPLMAHSIVLANSCESIQKTIVSTDSAEYAEIAMQWDANIIMRNIEISNDSAGDLEVIRHFLKHYDADLVVYLRPTTPFRTSTWVNDAVRLMSVPGYDSLRSVEEMTESAYKCFSIKAGILRPLTKMDCTDLPNQKLPKTYHPNGYIDIMRREIVENGSLWGKGRYAFVTPRTIEIDTEEDFDYAEWYSQYKMKGWGYGKT